MCGEQSSEDHDDGNDESVQSNSLSENEDEDHTNEDGVSLGIGSYTGITGNTNSESSSEGAESASKSSSEIFVAILLRKGLVLDLGSSDNGNDDTINTQDTSHNNRNKTLEDLTWLDDGERRDTNSGLGGTIGSSQVGEDKGRCNSDVGEEVGGFYKRASD